MTSEYNWQDPFNLLAELTDQERMICDLTREFASTKLQPTIQTAFRDEIFDKKLMREMGERGFLGATFKEYGCAGVSPVTYGLIARELERVDSAYRSAMSVQSSLVMYAIDTYGSDRQKQKYMPKLATGELIGCFGLTEANHGSDPGAMNTQYVVRSGEYVLNGSKMWITNSPIADVFIIWSKNSEGKVEGFVLDKEMPGVSTPTMHGKMSLRASITGEIVLSEVVVTEENRLPKAQGLKAPLSCLDNARYGIAWGVLGAAEFCWLTARDYVMTREQFGRPLAACQLIQTRLANMQTQIGLATQACLRVGRMKEKNNIATPVISLIKRNSTLIALDIARDARDMLGANGIMEDFHVMRHLVNLETVKTYEGTVDIHALILGQAQTGISAFR